MEQIRNYFDINTKCVKRVANANKYYHMNGSSKIIGNIIVSDNVTIGASAVVTKDVPCNSIVIECNKMIRIDGDLE